MHFSLPPSFHLVKAGLQPSNLKDPFMVLFVNLAPFQGLVAGPFSPAWLWTLGLAL